MKVRRWSPTDWVLLRFSVKCPIVEGCTIGHWWPVERTQDERVAVAWAGGDGIEDWT